MAQHQPDRDESVERILRQSMRNGQTSAQPEACLDGETIAAWAEHGLRRADADAVERHLSGCARCSALLATLVKTSPEASVPESIWSRWRLRWLVPAATAATAVAVWFAIPGNDSISVFSEPPAAYVSAPPPASGTASDSPAAPESTPALAQAPEASSASSARGQESDRRQLRDSRVAQPAPTTAPRSEASERERRADAGPPQQQQEQFSAAARDAASEQTAERKAEQKIAEEQAKPASPLAERVQVQGPTPPAPAGEAAAARPAAARMLSVANAPVQIVSPDPTSRWRIAEGRQVEHSATGGATWQRIIVPTTEVLTAGSSPAASVCWIVGRAGTVLVTTDGLRFMRVPFPEAVNLASIRATDDRSAVVMTEDGRAFRTNDRGMSWLRNAQ